MRRSRGLGDVYKRQNAFGLVNEKADVVTTDALRGIPSKPAVAAGTQIAINVNNNFGVDETTNSFVVTVDGVKGVVTLPVNANYTLDGFISDLQERINMLADTKGTAVSGVKVAYDRITNSLSFTSGTTGADSFIQVSGSATWGLSSGPSGRGETTNWIKPTQYTDYSTGQPQKKYINNLGIETSSADGYAGLPEWSPIYLEKGELTFDTSGKLLSPLSGAQLDTVFLPDGKGSLTININYSKSTQYSSPFAVLSQSQDGAPEGEMVGVSIGDYGLVNASYSNGSQKSLGKIVLVNFTNPSGLRQIGGSSYYSSSSSGTAKYGEAGGAGFGTIRAGATERANVDLTQELVDLITAQRNFQASAKAIETSSSLTQTITNIRN
jgi:flagellar hook-basal body protein